MLMVERCWEALIHRTVYVHINRYCKTRKVTLSFTFKEPLCLDGGGDSRVNR